MIFANMSFEGSMANNCFILYVYVNGISTSPYVMCFSSDIEAKARTNNREIVMFARAFIFNRRSRAVTVAFVCNETPF